MQPPGPCAATAPGAAGTVKLSDPEGVAADGVSRALTITNNFDYPVRLVSMAAAPDYPETDDCASASRFVAGASCTIDIAFQPAAKGAAPAVVSIVDSAVVAPMRVYLTGTGN